ncbi:MAG: sensor histidine kinase [Candidatus Acetothermia bacterium]
MKSYLEQDQRRRSLDELKEIILKTIRVRRVTLTIFLVLALYFRFGAGLNFPLPLIFSPLMWEIITIPFARLIEAQKSKEALHNVHFGYFVIEVAILTYLIHIIGGTEWIGVAFYVFSVLYANFFLPPKKGWTITFLVIGFFTGISYAEYAGLIAHWSIFERTANLHENSFYVTTTILTGGVGLYVSTAYTVQMFAKLFREKNESLREREAKLESLWRELISAREEERRRIAKRLHDQLGQRLMGIKMKLDILGKEMEDSRIREIEDLLSDAISESRNLSHLLRPSTLDELGLTAALRELVENYKESTDIGFETSLNPDIELREEEKRTILYRAAHELLNNAIKHGNPESISLELGVSNTSVRLVIEDDGQGFNPDEVVKEPGLGLQGIRENVNIAGGKFEIDSEAGKGTRAEILLPME